MAISVNGNDTLSNRRHFLKSAGACGLMVAGLAGGAETFRQTYNLARRAIETFPSSILDANELERYAALNDKQNTTQSLTLMEQQEYLALDKKLREGQDRERQDFEQFRDRERWQRGFGILAIGTAANVAVAAANVLLK